MGRLVYEPELHKTAEGTSVVSLLVAVDKDYVKQGEERQADFIDVVAWRKTAEFISKYFHKGSMIAVKGSIQTRNWEDKNGSKRKTTEIIAETVSFCGSKTSSAPNIEVPSEGTFQEIPDYDDYIPSEDDMPF